MIVFQFTYTTLFGFHSSFLLLRTRSLLPSISAHIFCNFMGFPQLQEELQRYSSRRRRKPNPALVLCFKLIHTDAEIVFAYFIGIALYIYGMRTWMLTTR